MSKIKVLYITSPSFFDVDISLVKKLREKVELVFLLDLPCYALKQTALDINEQPKDADIISVDYIGGFEKYKDSLPINSYVINRPRGKLFSREAIKVNLRLKAFINELNPDLIHYNNPIGFTGLFSLFNTRKKIITIHDPIPHLGESQRNILLKAINLSFIPNVFILNQYQRKAFLKKFKLNENNVYNSQLGPYDYYNNLELQEINDRRNNQILFFGRLTEYKGIGILLDAFVAVRKKYPDATLIIAGNGVFNFEKYDLTNVRIIKRFIPIKEMQQLMKSSAFIVCPYLEATQSGVVMTAYSFFTPVIATEVGGLPEMVINDKTGLTVPPNDVQALQIAIEKLISSPEKVEMFATNISRIFFKNGINSWNYIAKGMVGVYEKILNI
jgi:glycosyltransferase involved in cell wall biosynthesis